MHQTMNSRRTAAQAEATAAQPHTASSRSATSRSVPLSARWVRTCGYARACVCTRECGGVCGYGRVRCAAPLFSANSHSQREELQLLFRWLWDPGLKLNNASPHTQPLGATHSEVFVGAQTQDAGRGCAEPRVPLIRQRAGNNVAMASALRAAPAACSAPGAGAR